MEPSELLIRFATVCEALDISYRVVGSMASIGYGEPRLTNDIDILVQLSATQAGLLCSRFPGPEYYCSLEAARQAVFTRHQFNILHPSSGLKIDVLVADDSAYNRSRFSRGQRLLADDTHEAWFASPEDVILKKLVYFKEGGSEKHLRDIVGILKVQADAIEQAYLAEWIAKLGVEEEWQLVQSRMPKP